MTWTRRRRWLASSAAILGVAFLVQAARWVSEGCPLGFALGSCSSAGLGGARVVTASSDRLFDTVRMTVDAETTVVDLGSRRVVVRGDEATIGRASRVALPAASKRVEFEVRGDTLRVLADGRVLPPQPLAGDVAR